MKNGVNSARLRIRTKALGSVWPSSQSRLAAPCQQKVARHALAVTTRGSVVANGGSGEKV
jgi:hypothetical protein